MILCWMLCHPSQSLTSISFLSPSPSIIILCSHCLIRCSVIHLFIRLTDRLIYLLLIGVIPLLLKFKLKDFNKKKKTSVFVVVLLCLRLCAHCCGVAELSSLEMSPQSNSVFSYVASFYFDFPFFKVGVSVSSVLFFVLPAQP